MAQRHYKAPFEKALLQFITEPGPLTGRKWPSISRGPFWRAGPGTRDGFSGIPCGETDPYPLTRT